MSKLNTIGQIIEGHGNNLLDKVGLLPEDMAALAESRLSVCQTCDKFTPSQTCAQCGCYMPAKTKALKASCPHPDGPKWR